MEANKFSLEVKGVAAIPYIIETGNSDNKVEIARSQFVKAFYAWFAAEAERIGGNEIILSVDGKQVLEVKMLELEEGEEIELPHMASYGTPDRVLEQVKLFEEQRINEHYYMGNDELGWAYLYNSAWISADITPNPLNTDKYLVSKYVDGGKQVMCEKDSFAEAKAALVAYANELEK